MMQIYPKNESSLTLCDRHMQSHYPVLYFVVVVPI